MKSFYLANAPFWLKSDVWAAEAVFSDPFLYVVLATVLFLEWRIPANRRQGCLSIGFWQDFFWFLGNRIVWFSALALLAHSVRVFYQAHLSFLTFDVVTHLPRAARIVLAILLFDFLDWARHYIKHRIWWLWIFHAVHHSQREMNLFSDFRVHAVEGVINLILLFIPLSMFEVGIPADFYIAIVLGWYRMIYHANIRTNYGPLKYILVTPQSHRVHHSSERQHADTNFGVLFTFWDRLFGTHWKNYDDYPPTGIGDERFPVEQAGGKPSAVFGIWVRQMAYPLVALIRRARALR